MKRTAKVISKATLGISKAFVNASSPLIYAPKIPNSLKKQK
ncbi:cyclic lactone autoinducer peptide [Halalkalibacterium halodurans]|jgi:cyclic lactone autoinducer peptide|nr:cyclic lactone autoinducer peptide [Halalkalibacterium halodurans]MED3646668.1 cyclic lactone autoinducer peptide [Halalkalibacterium halodurans]MED4164281.1 cyclic lactone autoinducer peptide [Halalkalibacterium halodurans]TES52403.1 cyclic lactone autoinducer peptide [Halalkalibacterium halodurans]